MKAGKKGKFQGNSKMVPGAPVGFRVGSLDMGGLRAKDTKKEEKVEAVETGDKKKSEKLVTVIPRFWRFLEPSKFDIAKIKIAKIEVICM